MVVIHMIESHNPIKNSGIIEMYSLTWSNDHIVRWEKHIKKCVYTIIWF